MPYIDSKVTTPLTEQKKEILKQELGKIITLIPGKSENYLMLGFEDNYSLYFKGMKLDFGAFIEVKIFGAAPKAALDKVTQEICALYLRELDIPSDCIYIKYEEVSAWGFDGRNF
ncbi:phenylpyruvate tautomerase MIF-related protein [Cellulosilyticum sp. I15G10I2]|uniref:phenylpyruvate tautomerase MIF-related protein n=1 Tax=Cellulosilyticum sp. I15G10I2 TaxID=1892843 RepID=UPI00085C8524|nr:phenylpyruvate tautomerase MIF-related protein [Cellulosilyticum sp. I15G10I2]